MWRNAYLRQLIKSFFREWIGNLAARRGAMFVLCEWGMELSGYSDDALDLAARNGHLDVIKWLHANRTEGGTGWAMDLAALNGHLDVIKWLHAHRTEGCTKSAINWAAINGHLDVIKWLEEHPKTMF